MIRLERRTVKRIDIQVPWTQPGKSHFLGTALVHFLLQRKHKLLDAFMEVFAVGRSVIKTVLGEEYVIDKILAVRVLRDLLANCKEFVVRFVERFLVLETALPHRSPCTFAKFAVRLFHVSA